MSHSLYLAILFKANLGEKLGNFCATDIQLDQSQGREECSTAVKSTRMEKSRVGKSRVKKSGIVPVVRNEEADTAGLVDLLYSIL